MSLLPNQTLLNRSDFPDTANSEMSRMLDLVARQSARLAKLEISEEEMRREFERIHSAADLSLDKNKNQLYADGCAMAAWIGFQSAILMMQERCK